MRRSIESQLSGPHLERYREKCRKHPWYRDASELILDWNDKVRRIKDKGEDPKAIFDDPYALPVDEVLGFAKAVQYHPDVWHYFADYVTRQKTDPNAEFPPDFLEILGPFGSWYFLHRGKPPQRDHLFAGRAVIIKFLKGELPSLDGREAREYALSVPGTSGDGPPVL
jgi:hypothetical protein